MEQMTTKEMRRFLRAAGQYETEIERTMKLLGVSTLAELEPRHVTQLQRLSPVPGVGAAASVAPARRAAPSRVKA